MTGDFLQWTRTTRTYHADHQGSDGEHLPIVSKPNWTIEHRAEDPNVAQSLGTMETSADGTSARITTHDQPGTITVTVSASVSPSAFATKTFTITVKRHLPVTTRSPTFKVTQSRNSSINH
jgi:flagellar basal body P-ring protein FlgI